MLRNGLVASTRAEAPEGKWRVRINGPDTTGVIFGPKSSAPE